MNQTYFFHLFPNQTVEQTMNYAKHLVFSKPYWKEFVHFFSNYRSQRDFCNEYRLHPTKIRDINVDRFVHWKKTDSSEPKLTGLGRATSIYWDGKLESLPQGWTGTVQTAFDDIIENRTPNTYVALTAMVLPDQRKQGISTKIIQTFKKHAQERGYSRLIIALQETMRGQTPKLPLMPMSEFVKAKNEQGQLIDYWFRMHLKMGAKPLTTMEDSHCYAIPLKQFATYWEIPENSGEHVLARPKKELPFDECQPYRKWYINHEQELALTQRGCLWVEYEL